MGTTGPRKRKRLTDVLNTLGTDPPGTKAVTTTGTSGKRARTDAEKDVPRAGKNLGDLPTDLTTHIVCHLTPGDLLSLRMTNRFFKEFLTSPKYWKDAEKACGLPKCPPDFSHWQYAAWIFGKDCTACHGLYPTKRFFNFRARLCKKCFSDRIKVGTQIVSLRDIPMESTDDVFSLAPGLAIDGRHRVIKWTSAFVPSNSAFYAVFYQPSLKAAYEEYLRQRGESQKRHYVASRRNAVLEANKLAKTLTAWDKRRTKGQDPSEFSPEKRKVLGRLRELGYSDVDLNDARDMPDWEWGELVEMQGVSLGKAWAKKFLPRLRDTILLRMINTRGYNARKRYAELLRLIKELMETRCFVTLRSVLQIHLVRAAINPSSPPFRKTDLCALKKAVQNVNKRFPDMLLKSCIPLLTESRGCKPASNGLAHLRTACHRPAAFFVYREHPEQYDTQLKTYQELLEGIQEECRKTLNDGNAKVGWTFDSRVEAAPAFLINALHDSLKVTALSHGGMATMGSRFKCLRCKIPEFSVRRTMTWVELVRHYYDHNKYFYRKYGGTWSTAVASDASNTHGTEVNAFGPLACDVTQIPPTEADAPALYAGYLSSLPILSDDHSRMYFAKDFF